MLDVRFHILVRIGVYVVHDTTVGKVIGSSLYHTIGSVIRQSRDHRVIRVIALPCMSMILLS